MAITDQTLAQLRRRVADRFGDLLMLTATGNGTTTTFVDTLNVNNGTDSCDGRQIYFTSGSNASDTSRITTTTASTGTLTFTPAQTSTATNDTAELYNTRNRGFLVAEYHRAINEAIEEANGLARVRTIETIAAAFDEDTQTIAMPSTLWEAYKVEFQDSDGIWTEIKKATTRGGYGWTAEPSNAVIRVEGNSAGFADGYTVRVHGFKEQDQLATDAAVCSFDGHAIVCIAAYRLCMANLSKDSYYGSLLLTLRDEYERAKPRLRTPRPPGTVPVRL
jgi:hypothetical protein